MAKCCNGKHLRYKDREILVDFLAILPSSLLSTPMPGPGLKLEKENVNEAVLDKVTFLLTLIDFAGMVNGDD
ncbi:hypothetical protein llap_4676 [Limosa lapponica baueri]|uniref:Uncharacterized protein n=1 Tax=Limosa lapponica baueri TaxID=1758121 RepID=A0A2I0UG61_LIMLA|nr:hypothetical protein llap_4676 [Limosa lapponica baueri]